MAGRGEGRAGELGAVAPGAEHPAGILEGVAGPGPGGLPPLLGPDGDDQVPDLALHVAQVLEDDHRLELKSRGCCLSSKHRPFISVFSHFHF